MLERIKGTGEFAFLESLLAEQGSAVGNDVLIGPGDDCAVLDFGADSSLKMLMATDAIIEDVHFTRSAYSYSEIGRKALIVNLSDIAAMGGTPLFATISAAVPADMDQSDLSTMMSAVDSCASEYSVKLVGGDLTRSDKISLSVSIVGSCSEGSVLSRGGAADTDMIMVTGTMGDSKGGLDLIAQGHMDGHLQSVHRNPIPRITEGRALAAMGATSMIDISDGLLQDVGHLCEASGTKAFINEMSVPVSDELRSEFPETYSTLAVSGGEDYELAFTVPKGFPRDRLVEFTELTGTTISVIGRMFDSVASPAPGVPRLTGGSVELRGPTVDGPLGWDSFTSGSGE